MTQQNLILQYLKENPEWHYVYKFHGLETQNGFIGSQGDRRVRELIKKGLIERRMEGKFVQVRHKQPVYYILDPRWEETLCSKLDL